jgi:hypothetical protein
MEQPNVDPGEIAEHMAVVDSHNIEFATVDHTDVGNSIKLTKDDEGQHHWIPQQWVARVDDRVHIDRPASQAEQEWSTSAPKTD